MSDTNVTFLPVTDARTFKVGEMVKIKGESYNITEVGATYITIKKYTWWRNILNWIKYYWRKLNALWTY